MNRLLDRLFKRQQPASESKSKNEELNNRNDLEKERVKESVDSTVRDLSDDEKNLLIEKLAQRDLFCDLTQLDEFFYDAARLVVLNKQGSTTLIQRKFLIGYNRAVRIMDQLEIANIVGPSEGSKARKIFFADESSLEQYLKTNADWIKLFYEENKLAIEQKQAEIADLRQQELDKLAKEEIKQQILEKARKKRLGREALNELKEDGKIFNEFTNKEGKRELIPQDIMDKVWNRDGGKCVKCGSQENLEFDHIIPFSKGGATSYRNMQLLCKKCNIEKSNKIG
jgi:hypothetical protein